jgi:hypothetical protein
MRFLAADMFKNVSVLHKEAEQIAVGLLKSRLQSEIAALTDTMRDLEMQKDQDGVDKVFASLNKLRERLAQINARV